MKKIKIRNDFHGTEAGLLVPESIESTSEAMEWLELESHREREKLGYYAQARKKQLNVWRQLCGIKGCRCNIKIEKV